MKIYFDVCALGRLFDNQDQSRIRAESEAVQSILDSVQVGAVQWISSTALETEIAQNSNILRRMNTQLLLRKSSHVLAFTPAMQDRARSLQAMGTKQFDALHLAVAEAADAEALITTDDRLIRLCARLQKHGGLHPPLTIQVLNPIDWLRKRRSK